MHEASSTSNHPEASTGLRVALLAASSLTVMAGATIAPALPAMVDHFRDIDHTRSAERIAFLVKLGLTGPGLFTAIGSLAAGALVDRFGRYWPLVIGLVAYVVAGTSGMYVRTIEGLLVGRALLGLAVALVMVATTSLIGDWFVGPARQRFNGWQGACMSFGGVVFLVAAGYLADVSWRSPFLIYLTASAVFFAVLVFVPRGARKPSVTGSSGPATGAGIASFSAWLPVLVLGVAFLGMIMFYMIPTQLPFRLRTIGVLEHSRSGIAIGVNGLVAGLVSMNYAKIRERLSFAAVAGWQMLIMGLGFVSIAGATSYPLTLAACALTGLGQGLMLPNAMAWMQSIAPPQRLGRLVGLLVSAVFFGQFFSPIAMKPIVDWVGPGGSFAAAGGLMLVITAALLSQVRRLSAE
ncbi:MAG: MFS transporter [Phycisphaerales bacterium]|nr:MFS transporter [Phycisphaerales bacterium]